MLLEDPDTEAIEDGWFINSGHRYHVDHDVITQYRLAQWKHVVVAAYDTNAPQNKNAILRAFFGRPKDVLECWKDLYPHIPYQDFQVSDLSEAFHERIRPLRSEIKVYIAPECRLRAVQVEINA